jgi:hypothetical protein
MRSAVAQNPQHERRLPFSITSILSQHHQESQNTQLSLFQFKFRINDKFVTWPLYLSFAFVAGSEPSQIFQLHCWPHCKTRHIAIQFKVQFGLSRCNPSNPAYFVGWFLLNCDICLKVQSDEEEEEDEEEDDVKVEDDDDAEDEEDEDEEKKVLIKKEQEFAAAMAAAAAAAATSSSSAAATAALFAPGGIFSMAGTAGGAGGGIVDSAAAGVIKVPAQRPLCPPTHPMHPTMPLGMQFMPPPHLAAALAAAAGNPLAAADYASWLCRPTLPPPVSAAGIPGYFPLPSNLLAARLGGKNLGRLQSRWFECVGMTLQAFTVYTGAVKSYSIQSENFYSAPLPKGVDWKYYMTQSNS